MSKMTDSERLMMNIWTLAFTVLFIVAIYLVAYSLLIHPTLDAIQVYYTEIADALNQITQQNTTTPVSFGN